MDINVKLYVGGQNVGVKPSHFSEVDWSTDSVSGLAYHVVSNCRIYQMGNQHDWENVVAALKVYIDGVESKNWEGKSLKKLRNKAQS